MKVRTGRARPVSSVLRVVKTSPRRVFLRRAADRKRYMPHLSLLPGHDRRAESFSLEPTFVTAARRT
ncbi:hypothetical protein EVAR_103119_1 [Eumeta japonica]|uniref:Uncharacterized protein n=1 Tax=Eumeta variegata TaxID=151549 RepID=A0A4C1X1G7_EUMVA|nr:hypothetical protein EVAR_103119_1 [Eumeta japonica]